MRYFGTHNRNKALFTNKLDIDHYVDEKRETPMHQLNFWLVIHPEHDIATSIFGNLLRLAELESPEVSHDELISWLAAAIRCQPQFLVPCGEAISVREVPSAPVDPRGSEWNASVGITQTCLLLKYLSRCSVEKLSVDERANVIFALLRIFGDSDEAANSPHAEILFRHLYTADERVDTIEALAAVFFQISNDVATMADAIRTIFRLTEDEPLVMRLTVEILMCLCQRSEIATTLPDFRMGDQMYCNQVKVIILDLTSDAHESVPDLQQKDELSNLVNEMFNLRS
uniref:Uncharacterized protein n=1 Tax=Caenorhabditis japonica TaxID=281687 RepID=A0A8R1ETY0_CAEJA